MSNILQSRTVNELLTIIKTKPNWDQKDVITMLSTSKKYSSITYKVPKVTKGDIWKHGGLNHMCMVVDCYRGMYTSLILTSIKDEKKPFVIGTIDARFMSSDVTAGMLCTTEDCIKNSWVGNYPNRRYINKLIRIAKSKYNIL